MPRRQVALVALLLLAGCASPQVDTPEPAGSPSPLPSVMPSERLPRCSALSATALRDLTEGVRSAEITVLAGATVSLPKALRSQGYTTLVGVTLGGPGVDGQHAVLASRGGGRSPLAVDDLARASFPRWARDKDSSTTGRYRAGLATSDAELDALACAAAAQ